MFLPEPLIYGFFGKSTIVTNEPLFSSFMNFFQVRLRSISSESYGSQHSLVNFFASFLTILPHASYTREERNTLIFHTIVYFNIVPVLDTFGNFWPQQLPLLMLFPLVRTYKGSNESGSKTEQVQRVLDSSFPWVPQGCLWSFLVPVHQSWTLFQVSGQIDGTFS